MYGIYVLFWDITLRRLVILHRHFGTTYRFHLQGSSSPRTWVGNPEASVRNYHSRLRNTPEERRSQMSYSCCSLRRHEIAKPVVLNVLLEIFVANCLFTDSYLCIFFCFNYALLKLMFTKPVSVCGDTIRQRHEGSKLYVQHIVAFNIVMCRNI